MLEYRGYVIQPIKNLIGYEIRHTGKGSLPYVMSGIFTSKDIATSVIDQYVNTKDELQERKEQFDGATDSSGGSEQVQRRANYRRKPVNNAG